MSFFKISVVSILGLILTGCFMFSGKPDLAAKYQRKAEVAVDKGQINRAISLLHKAVGIKPEMANQAYLQIALLHFNEQRQSAAVRVIEKIDCGKKDCTAEEELEILAWKGTFALQMGEIEKALFLNQRALNHMDLYLIENDSLRSIILNNRAVSDIFDQGKHTGFGQEGSYRNIHISDCHRAAGYLEEAIQLDPQNCVVEHNYNLVQSILAIDSSHWEYGILVDSLLPDYPTPEFDCLKSVEKETENPIIEQINAEVQEVEELLLVLDISGSMEKPVVDDKGGTKSRFSIMLEVCDSLLNNIDTAKTKVGAITIGQDCNKIPFIHVPVGEMSPLQLNQLIQNLEPFGSTPLDERILMGSAMYSSKKKSEKVMMLFSDGIGSCSNTYEGNICAVGPQLEQRGIRFFVLALLIEENQNSLEYGVYNCLAQSTNGLLLGMEDATTIKRKEIEIKPIPVAIPLIMGQVESNIIEPFIFEDTFAIRRDTIPME